jgi:hypothetical protein
MGLGLGADQTIPTVVAGGVIMIVTAGLRWARRGKELKNLFLSIEWPHQNRENALSELQGVISRHVSSGDLRRVDQRNGSLEVTYFVDVSGTGPISDLVADLNRSFPGVGVSFIDQSQLPSV